MEDKRLDLNQPLLTVRRNFTSPLPDHSLHKISRPPIYQSELKSGDPVRNPGTVPFVWEKTPGHPKETQVLEQLNSIAPKLPPSKLTCLNVTHKRKDDMESQVNFKSSYNYQQTSLIITNSKEGERRKIIDLESQESCDGRYYSKHTFVVPPLPKAPSESWLKRTLPTVSSRNSSSRSCLGTCNYAKWETMVRYSNVHQGCLRFSKEQLPPITEA